MKEEKKRARLIYNPTSGQEMIKQNIAEVLEVLESMGYETKWLMELHLWYIVQR